MEFDKDDYKVREMIWWPVSDCSPHKHRVQMHPANPYVVYDIRVLECHYKFFETESDLEALTGLKLRDLPPLES